MNLHRQACLCGDAMNAPVHFYIIETYSKPRIIFVQGKAVEIGGQDFQVHRCTEADLVRDITDGQIEHVQKILEVNEDLGSCREITGDIANGATQLIYQRGAEWPEHLQEFLRRAA
jgi:hypothetical protein